MAYNPGTFTQENVAQMSPEELMTWFTTPENRRQGGLSQSHNPKSTNDFALVRNELFKRGMTPETFSQINEQMMTGYEGGGAGGWLGEHRWPIAAIAGASILGAGAAGLGAGGGSTAAGGGLTAEAAGSTAALSGAGGSGIGLTEATLGTGAVSTLGSDSATSPDSTVQPVPIQTANSPNNTTPNSNSIDPNTLASLIQGGSALWAGQQGVDAADKATDELRRQFDIGQTNAAPWLEAGKNALGAQQDLMGLGANGPEAQLSSLMNSPGYKFRRNQGNKNLEASSAARGGMGSGKAMTAMSQYGQDYASNEYGNRLNQLAGVSGTGQVQANNNMNAGMNYAGEMGNASLAGAQARQSGILGAGSALSNWMNPQPKQMTLADLLRSQ